MENGLEESKDEVKVSQDTMVRIQAGGMLSWTKIVGVEFEK